MQRRSETAPRPRRVKAKPPPAADPLAGLLRSAERLDHARPARRWLLRLRDGEAATVDVNEQREEGK
jgi:hypothetical protein